MFQPKILNPAPDPWFVREIRKIDASLRVVWGYNQYLMNVWVVERRLEPERYFTMYSSLLSGDGPRFVDQPVFEAGQQIGTRRYDLAPEWEYVVNYPALNSAMLLDLRRAYAMARNPKLRAEEKARSEDLKTKAFENKCEAATDQALDQAFLDTGKRVQFGWGKHRSKA